MSVVAINAMTKDRNLTMEENFTIKPKRPTLQMYIDACNADGIDPAKVEFVAYPCDSLIADPSIRIIAVVKE